MTIANGNMQYHDDAKYWECAIPHNAISKYNIRQIINRVNTKRNANTATLRPGTSRVTNVEGEKENRRILQTDHVYGGITVTYVQK